MPTWSVSSRTPTCLAAWLGPQAQASVADMRSVSEMLKALNVEDGFRDPTQQALTFKTNDAADLDDDDDERRKMNDERRSDDLKRWRCRAKASGW